MIISHTHKYVFVKTKKTAGTSIECALAPHLKPGDLASPLIEHQPRVRPLSREFVRLLREKDPDIKARNPHLPAEVVLRHFEKEAQGYHSFCVERNPWTKAISAFFFWISRHPAGAGASMIENFNDFVQSQRLTFFSNFEMYMQNDRQLVDRVLRFENLEAELSQVTNHLGLPDLKIRSVREKGAVRPGNTRDITLFYGADFDNPASRRVRSVFSREIDYFGYQPENPD